MSQYAPAARTNESVAQTLKDPFENPFDAVDDRDRHVIWQFLVAADADAFALADWSMIASDFAAERFEGIDANGSTNPADWSLRYPTVDDYRVDWLKMADVFLAKPLVDVPHRELLYRMTSLAGIEMTGDRAIVRKCFYADERLNDGGRFQVSVQSIYRLHRIERRWMIAGFVGYLPLEYSDEME